MTIIISTWIFFGLVGFFAWRYEAHRKNIKLENKDWIILLIVFIISGFIAWILSFTPITRYIDKDER